MKVDCNNVRQPLKAYPGPTKKATKPVTPDETKKTSNLESNKKQFEFNVLFKSAPQIPKCCKFLIKGQVIGGVNLFNKLPTTLSIENTVPYKTFCLYLHRVIDHTKRYDLSVFKLDDLNVENKPAFMAFYGFLHYNSLVGGVKLRNVKSFNIMAVTKNLQVPPILHCLIHNPVDKTWPSRVVGIVVYDKLKKNETSRV